MSHTAILISTFKPDRQGSINKENDNSDHRILGKVITKRKPYICEGHVSQSEHPEMKHPPLHIAKDGDLLPEFQS